MSEGAGRPEPAPLARTSAVVVNHNAGDALLACVASLRAGGVDEVVVVDNASSDNSLVRLAAADGRAVLVPAGANLGYGRAANLGVRRSAGDYVLVCNPDLLLDPDAPARLVGHLEAHPACAAVGPLVRDPGGARQASARAFPGLSDALGHAALSLVRPDNPFTRRYHLAEADLATPSEVDWVSGACVALRRVAFDSVGGFDPGYFMYVEDLDLCWRLHQAGWDVAYLPDAEVTHVGGVSARARPYAMLLAHHRSTLRFFARSAKGRERWLLPAVAAALACRLALACGLLAARRARAARGPTDRAGVRTCRQVPGL